MELVYMDGKQEPYTLSSIVAECAEIKHRHLKILLNKHREDFERFGKVTFKISPSESGQNVRDYILNEQQATLEDMAIAMINLGMTYQDIKSMVFRPKENAPQGA